MSLRLFGLGAMALLLAALAGEARAQPATLGSSRLPLAGGTPVLTLEIAEKLLVERNLAVLAARRGVDIARAQRLVAGQIPPMALSVGNVAAQFNETPSNAFEGGRGLGPNNNVNVGLTAIVERGGKRTLRSAVADANISVAEAQVLDALRAQLLALRQSFLLALQARANLEVALGNRTSLDRTEGLLRRQLRDGAIPEGDLLRFQANRVQFEQEVTNAALGYAQNVAQLAPLLATDAAAFQAGAGQLPALGIAPVVPEAPPPARPRRGAAPAVAETAPALQTILSPVAFDVRGRFDTRADLGLGRDELAQAVPQRPDVLVALRQAGSAAANTLLAEAARSRDVTVGVGWARTRLGQNIPELSSTTPYANNTFSLNFSVPIFTRGIVEGNVGIAAGQQAQAEAQARLALFQARAEFAGAWAAYEQGRALLALYTGGAIARAEEAYQTTERAYLAGGRSLIDVMDALRTLNATRAAANNARYAHLVALAQLEAATGASGVMPKL
jgi:outer membrane protein TolC